MSGPLFSQPSCNFTQSSPVLSARSKRAFRDRIDAISPILWRDTSPPTSGSPVISQLTLTPTKSPTLKRIKRGKDLESLSQPSHIEILTPSPPAPSVLNDTIVSVTDSVPSLPESEDSNLLIEDVEDEEIVGNPKPLVLLPYTQTVTIISSGKSSSNPSESTEATPCDINRNHQRRRSYKKGGLALKVLKALRKRRSEHRLGNHLEENARADDSIEKNHTDLLLWVSAVRHIFSSVFVDCECRSEAVDSGKVTLVFDEEQWRRQEFLAGCTVKISPPWKVVTTRSGLAIVAPGNIHVQEHPRVEENLPKCDKTAQVLEIWDCPCSSSEQRAFSAKYCDAQTEIWGLRNMKT